MTEIETIKSSIKVGLKVFEDNTAAYRKINENFDVLDFRRPNSVTYSFRMVFDREHGNAAYISGDLGEAVIYPTCECTLEGFAKCFTSRLEDGTLYINERYFKEKIRACNPNYGIYTYEVDDVKADLRDQFDICGGAALWDEFEEEYFDALSSDVKVFPTFGVVFSDRAEEFLRYRVGMETEDFRDIGKRTNQYVVFWLVAIRLAWEQLEAKNADNQGR